MEEHTLGVLAAEIELLPIAAFTRTAIVSEKLEGQVPEVTLRRYQIFTPKAEPLEKFCCVFEMLDVAFDQVPPGKVVADSQRYV